MERVVITGLGALTSLGADARSLWSALLAGKSGVSRVPHLEGAAVDIGAAVDDAALDALTAKEHRLDRTAQLGLVSAAAALSDAGVSGPLREDGERAGVVFGSSRGVSELLEDSHERFVKAGAEAVPPHASPYTTAGNLSGAVARKLGLRGPALSVSTACSSASQAIGLAFDLVRHGRTDLMVAGGAEACLTPFSMAMLEAAGVLSHRLHDPAAASRPFDRERDGIVAAEGAGFVVLESLARARRRGARVYAEVLGFGSTCDAFSLTAVPADGSGLARALRAALADAHLSADAVDYVNAHGTATRTGDRAETAAIKTVLGERARRVPVSSTKSMTGHLIGAAGGVEAIACALAVTEKAVPPTINLDNPDPECDLDYVPKTARTVPVRVALSISMGFGGNNACLVLGAL
jgi:3-oxoacyl-[acyl-carrier-protein] synthase II